MTTKLTKIARRRDSEVPIGRPAALFLACPCGQRLDIDPARGANAIYRCTCGAAYDEAGWVLEPGTPAILSQLYRAERGSATREAFGAWWCGPEQFVHGRQEVIARFPRTSNDGEDVIVYSTRRPAEFFRIDTSTAIISTGSIDAKTVARIAALISSGMIAVVGR